LRVTPEVVLALAESQRIPARRVGDAWRFWRVALLEWLEGDQVAGSLTQPAPAKRPQAGSSTPPTVGEQPSTPTSGEIALRDQRVLLKRGAVTADFGASYGRIEHTLYPVVRAEERAVGVSGTLRYGLLDDLQLVARVPAVWRRTTTFSDATIAGTSSPRIHRERLAGDASISLLGVALRETVGLPTVVWSLDGVVPTGTGDRGVGGGLVLSKSYDPAVLFAGLTYLHGLSVNPSDSRRSLAKHNHGFQVGYTYAVNESLALSTALLGTYRNTRSPDGVAIPAPRESYALQLGTTWLLARGLFMEPAAAIRLGGDSPGLTVSLSSSYSFR
jgi:hypothetical protein